MPPSPRRDSSLYWPTCWPSRPGGGAQLLHGAREQQRGPERHQERHQQHHEQAVALLMDAHQDVRLGQRREHAQAGAGRQLEAPGHTHVGLVPQFHARRLAVFVARQLRQRGHVQHLGRGQPVGELLLQRLERARPGESDDLVAEQHGDPAPLADTQAGGEAAEVQQLDVEGHDQALAGRVRHAAGGDAGLAGGAEGVRLGPVRGVGARQGPAKPGPLAGVIGQLFDALANAVAASVELDALVAADAERRVRDAHHAVLEAAVGVQQQHVLVARLRGDEHGRDGRRVAQDGDEARVEGGRVVDVQQPLGGPLVRGGEQRLGGLEEALELRLGARARLRQERRRQLFGVRARRVEREGHGRAPRQERQREQRGSRAGSAPREDSPRRRRKCQPDVPGSSSVDGGRRVPRRPSKCSVSGERENVTSEPMSTACTRLAPSK
jgi:hypothetical protein